MSATVCPVCGSPRFASNASPLPHFLVCTECGGYVGEEAPVAYPKEDFAEGDEPTTLARLARPILQFFLYLRLRMIRRALRSAPNDSILDYGCGNGKVVAFGLARGLQVQGYDPSQGAVTLAQSRGLPVANDLPEPGSAFGLVMLWHSLEHTPDPLAVLRRVHELLAPGGKLLVAVPNAASWEATLAKERWFCYDWPRHQVHFTPTTLQALFLRAGFTPEWLNLTNLEYTLSSTAQTFLNLFLPADVLYSVVAHRRRGGSRVKALALAGGSMFLLLVASPILLIWFVLEWLFGKTGAMVLVGRKTD